MAAVASASAAQPRTTASGGRGGDPDIAADCSGAARSGAAAVATPAGTSSPWSWSSWPAVRSARVLYFGMRAEPSRRPVRPRRQVLALGGGGFLVTRRAGALERYLLGLSGRARPRVCFLATA